MESQKGGAAWELRAAGDWPQRRSQRPQGGRRGVTSRAVLHGRARRNPLVRDGFAMAASPHKENRLRTPYFRYIKHFVRQTEQQTRAKCGEGCGELGRYSRL